MKYRIIFLFVFLILTPYCVRALNTDAQLPIQVNADSAQFDKKTGIGTYWGHIQLIQGTTVIQADFGKTYLDDQGKLVKLMISGKPACYRTLLEPQQPEFIATGNVIYLYPIKGWVQLIGNAHLTQGHDQFFGPQVNYDFKKKLVIVPASNKGRTHIIVQSPKDFQKRS